jgi:indolepyruvate ferredoxin oxidoreductase beta subunit
MNMLLVGVGGQGTILASKIIAEVAMLEGHDVKMSEIHGMAQRGGSVVTQVRMGEKVYSPLIEEGEADFIVAFEMLEAWRWSHYLTSGGTMVVNEQKIEPMSVLTGQREYPAEILETLAERSAKMYTLDAPALAREVGNLRATNTVLLGALARHMDIPLSTWERAMHNTIPDRFLDLNLRAFAAGYER